MRIQHNIMAMNSYRNLSGNNNALSKNLEKLSSGYRINRAGDDAAGLAISEKMRAQISGLDQAQKNAQSGINLVKTAEGALTEVHDMLNRMVTLATQSANGTYEGSDRNKLQAEVDALVEEIDRIADNSNFNGTKLLDGSLTAVGASSTAYTDNLKAADVTVTTARVAAVTVDKAPSFTVNLDGAGFKTTSNGQPLTVTLNVGGVDVTASVTPAATGALTDDKIANAFNGQSVTINGMSFTLSSASGDTISFASTATPSAAASLNISQNVTISLPTEITKGADFNPSLTVMDPGSVSGTAKQAAASFDLADAMLTDGSKISIGGTDYTIAIGDDSKVAGAAITISDLEKAACTSTGDLAKLVAKKLTQAASANTTFSVGANGTKITVQSLETAATNNEVTVAGKKYDLTKEDDIKEMFDIQTANGTNTAGGNGVLVLQIGASSEETIDVSIASMKASALNIEGLDITNVTNANAAIDTIKAAIEQVSVTRGDLGAIQNRLEHTINNLGVMEENIQDAEANIRDTDIADEMMAYTKNNILIQSAQAMLAQANQVPQGVLQLMG